MVFLRQFWLCQLYLLKKLARLFTRFFSFFQAILALGVLLASKATPLLILLRMPLSILVLVVISSFSIGGCPTDRWGFNFYTQCPESRKFKVCSTCAGKTCQNFSPRWQAMNTSIFGWRTPKYVWVVINDTLLSGGLGGNRIYWPRPEGSITTKSDWH